MPFCRYWEKKFTLPDLEHSVEKIEYPHDDIYSEYLAFKVAEASASQSVPSLRWMPGVSIALKNLPADRRKLADMNTRACFRLRRQ
jgi:hypothetical protein